jgi:Tol biopolymer transport system component
MRHVPTRLVLLNRDGTEYTSLLHPSKDVCFGRLSPDGKKVLYTTQAPPTRDSAEARKEELAVVDIATKVSTPVAEVPLNGKPDGKKIAYSWMPKFEGKPEDAKGQEFESALVTCDPDGQNQKTIATEKGFLQGITLELLDWR